MEFKMSEQSRKNLEQFAKEIGAPEYMNASDRKEYEEDEERKRQEKIQKRIQKKIQKGFFKTSDELISYVLGGDLTPGKKIYNDNFLGTPDYMYRSPRNENIIVHYSLQYNDVDCPIGMGETYMTLEEFIAWAKLIGTDEHKEDGFLPCWHKGNDCTT